MKPKFFEINFRKGGEGAARTILPRVDCHYHTAAVPNFRGGCARPKLSAFRKISSDYFRTEARSEFRREVVAFAAIFVTAAIPLLSNVQALADFLRAIGGF